MKFSTNHAINTVYGFLLLCLIFNAGIAQAQQHAKRKVRLLHAQTDLAFEAYRRQVQALPEDSLVDTASVYRLCFSGRCGFHEYAGRKTIAALPGEAIPSNMARPIESSRHLLWCALHVKSENRNTTLDAFLAEPGSSILGTCEAFSFGRRYVIVIGRAMYTQIGNCTQAGYLETYYLEKINP